MSERLTVDSVMTADGEVVPLGPVDKDGHRVPLDTTSLYGPRGEHYKVKSFVHFPLMDGWFMECAFTKDLIDVSSLHLKSARQLGEAAGGLSRDFIELYDDDGYRYIVNMDKISFVNVAGRKVWAGEAATLEICDESMERLLSRLRGEGDAD